MFKFILVTSIVHIVPNLILVSRPHRAIVSR